MLLKRRRKSLKNSVDDYTCERVRERLDGEEFEKLELAFRKLGSHSPRIQFYAWDDRWLWIGVTIAAPGRNAGWRVNWMHEGRVGAAGPHGVAQAIRETLRLPYESDEANVRGFLDGLWHGVATSGPRGIAG